MTYSRTRHDAESQAAGLATWQGKDTAFSPVARLEAGFLLRRLQKGEKISIPHSRPMTSIGRRCHELRLNDGDFTWRIIYRIDADAIVILEVFEKKTSRTPKNVIETCKARSRHYDAATK